MEKSAEKAFDLAAELVKQIIALSTGIIALTVTFAKDLFGVSEGEIPTTLTAAWISLFLAIVFGVWALMAFTGTLDPPERESGYAPTINGANCRLAVFLQIVVFLLGIGLTIWFAATA
ncbi:MAG: hypothetical protein AAF662_06515 [Pseudomonadota bacterium]